MIEKLAHLQPEMVLFIATCIVMVLGLSRSLAWRRLCGPVSALALGTAAVVAIRPLTIFGQAIDPMGRAFFFPDLLPFAKVLVAGVGFVLLLLIEGTVDRHEEDQLAAGKGEYNALRMNRAEFHAFFLFSLTGVMLCASATDLIWLFLALELTSLPTYVMVTISGRTALGLRAEKSSRAQEAGVKYFFLGALGAATFLYGFSLLYGASGTTDLQRIAEVFASNGLSSLAIAGLLLSIIGISFKIAAVPMHFYTPDVYQGASATVGAFLAFVPKTAGFFALMLIVGTVGWSYTQGSNVPGDAGTSLPDVLRVTLWVVAAMTMSVGNVLALLQTNVKRVLAYSSIAHSGYMLVGLITGPGRGDITDNGLAAVLFYLLCYGVMNLGTFAVLACLERTGREGERSEIESFEDLKGLCRTRPFLGWTLVLCSLSLLGLPPLLGFFGKFTLFTAGLAAGEIVLIIVLALNSAIAAYYYLRLAFSPIIDAPGKSAGELTPNPFESRRVAAIASAAGVIVLVIFGNTFLSMSREAGGYVAVKQSVPILPEPTAFSQPVEDASGSARAEGPLQGKTMPSNHAQGGH
jgi:NADH-quinone oxidoreductase subunit N